MKRLDAFTHGGNIYEASRLTGDNMGEFVDFSANINPRGVPESVYQAIQAQLPYIIHYPDAQASALKGSISTYYGVDQERIVAGNGAVELLYILCHIIKPRRVAIPAPTFSEYERAARAAGAEIEYIYMRADDNFALNTEAVLEGLSKADLLFLGNPNNPTGNLITNSELEIFIAAAQEQQKFIIVDESFMDFIANDNDYSCRSFLKRYDNLIIVQSMTKFYAIPGLRLGFMFASPSLCRTLHQAKDPWNVNSLAQAAGVAALNDVKYQYQSRLFMERERDYLFNQITSIKGCKPFRPSVNYILVDVAGTGIPSYNLRSELLAQGILIRDCSNYPGLSSAYIRVAVKTPELNELLVSALIKVTEGGI